jgi:hypothetical protein
MPKYIPSFIAGLIRKPRTTDGVLSTITTAIADLDAVVAERLELATEAHAAALVLLEESVEHDKERERATSVASRLRQLIA